MKVIPVLLKNSNIFTFFALETVLSRSKLIWLFNLNLKRNNIFAFRS